LKTDTLADRLQTVLDQVWAIRLDWQDPERFMIARSEAIGSLKALIKEAGHLQDSPAVTVKAQAALRLLQATDGPVRQTETAVIEPTKEPACASTAPAEKLSPPAEEQTLLPSEPAAVGDPSPPASVSSAVINQVLCELEHSICSAASALTRTLADIEKLALAARTAVASHAVALTLPVQATTAVTGISEERCQALIQQALQASAPAASHKQGNGKASIASPLQKRVVIQRPVRGAGKWLHRPGGVDHGAAINGEKQASPALTALAPGRYQRTDLNTDIGRARAGELWLAGYTQQTIGRHFAFERNGAPPVCLAIGRFVQQHSDVLRLEEGDRRKPQVREALLRFYAATAVADGQRPNPAHDEQQLPLSKASPTSH
jgi:hypothetical protein